jgi:hypothetical protein
MRSSLTLLIITAWIVAPVAWSQTAAPQAGTIQRNASDTSPRQPTASAPAGATEGRTSVTHAARRSTPRHSRSPAPAGAGRGSAQAGKSDAVLSLGATDITGNKELPKVMVIVPWKDSMGAGGVIKPTDSLMDEVLEPVDRGVFQRRIRYYGDLDAAGKAPAAGKVAPVGDSK